MAWHFTRQFFCISLLVFTPVVLADSLPSWVSNPTYSSVQLQAVGEGVTLREAERNAHAALGAEISVTVSEKFTSRQIMDGDFFREIIDLTTHSEVTGLWIVGAQIIKREKSGNFWYAMAALPYPKLISQQQQVLDDTVSRLAPMLSHSGQPATFLRWWQLRQQAPEIAKAESAAVLLSTFAPEQTTSSAMFETSQALLKQYYQEINLLGGQISFSIHNNTRHSPFSQLLSKQLAVEQLNVVAGNTPLTAKVIIDNDNNERRFGNELHLQKQLNIQLVYGQSVLSEQSLSEKAVSFGRAEDAHRTANQKLEKAIKKQSLIHTLLNQSF